MASQARRVDLALPAAVPVAELVPELARSVGLLESTTVHDGHRLVTAGGRVLVGDASLGAQGIVDGHFLAVVAETPEPALLYDDVAEAMAVVVERERAPLDPAFGRPTALTTAALLAALGVIALFTVGSVRAGTVAAALSLALTAGAVVLSRIRRDATAALGLAAAAAVYAGAAGLVLTPHGTSHLPSVVYAGAGIVLTGLACLAGLREHRSLTVPAVAVGAVLLGTGAVTEGTQLEPAVILTTVLSIVVMIGSFVPALALGVTGTMSEQVLSTHLPVDLDRVGSDEQLAHRIVIAASVTAGLLLLIGAPLAVSLGPSGVALAASCSLIMMLRARRHQAGSQVKVGLVSGIAGLLSVVTATLWLHPAWWPTVAPVLATAGVVGLFGAALFPSTPCVRRDRLYDLLESAALLATLPLLVVATGIFAAIRG